LVAVSKALRPGHVVGDGVDMYGSIWFFWYARDALENFANPSFTDLFFYPLGKDIFAHTGNNLLDATLSAPFQWVFGFPGWSRWWVVFLMVANALSFRVLARHLFASKNAALAATVAWQMNPYVLFEITCGRYTQAFLIFLPLALWAFLRMQEESGWKWPVLAGVFTGLQAWTYWFMGHFMAIAFLCLALDGLWRTKERKKLLLRCGLAGLCALIVVLPGLLPMSQAAADQLVPGLATGASKSLFSLPPALANNVAQGLHGYDLFGRNGPPMLTYWTWAIPLALWIVMGPGRRRWLPVLGVVLLFSLGPTCRLPFVEDPVIMPHYMALYHHFPFFDRLWFPYRMLVIAMVVAALAFGFLAQALEGRSLKWGARIPALLVLFVGCTGLEQSRYGIFPFVSRDLSPPELFEWIGEQEEEGPQAIIHLPFGPSQPNIVWQVIHKRPLWGGMGENASLLWPQGYRRRLKNSFFKALRGAVSNPTRKLKERPYVPVQRTMLERDGFRWVVLDRAILYQKLRLDPKMWGGESVDALMDKVLEGLEHVVGAAPVAAEGRFVVWDLLNRAEAPPALRPTPASLSEIQWSLVDVPLYEMQLVEAGRASRPRPPGMVRGEALKTTGKKRINKGATDGNE
jgi:hypothetical protein